MFNKNINALQENKNSNWFYAMNKAYLTLAAALQLCNKIAYERKEIIMISQEMPDRVSYFYEINVY